MSGGRTLVSPSGGVIHSRSPAAFVEQGGRWLWVTPSGCFLYLFEFPPAVIIGQFSWAVKDGQRTIQISMDPHIDFYIMASVWIGRDLEFHSFEADTVIGTDVSLLLMAEDVIEAFPHPGDEH